MIICGGSHGQGRRDVTDAVGFRSTREVTFHEVNVGSDMDAAGGRTVDLIGAWCAGAEA